MAKDLIREGTFNQKRENRYLVCRLPFSVVGATTEDFKLAHLPANSLIVDAYFFTTTVSNAATTDVLTMGTTEGGTQLVTAGNAKTAGRTGTAAAMQNTGTGVTVWVRHTVTGAKTAGESIAVIEYVEIDKTGGEYTRS
jgi:hypothetical protein